MARPHSRRSFLAEALQWGAGAWIVLTGVPAFLSGCVAKYGGPPLRPPGADAGAASVPDPNLTAEYGVRRNEVRPAPVVDDPNQKVPMYGVRPPSQPSPPSDTARPKYGVDPDYLERTSKYGVREPRPRVEPIKAPAYGVEPVPEPGPATTAPQKK